MNIILLLFIAVALYFVFRRDYKEIIKSISGISVPAFLALLAAGTGYQLLDAEACFTLIHSRVPQIKYRQAVEITFLGVFGNVSTFSAGIIPMQSYYLSRYGVQPGSSIGMLILKYVFHKTTIFFYAAVMLLVQNKWLRETMPELVHYIYLGFAVCAVIILALVLLCTWNGARQLLRMLIEKLPDTEKWKDKKSVGMANLDYLYHEAQEVIKNPVSGLKIEIWNLLKLTWLYAVPFLTMRILNISGPGFWNAQALTAIMFLITGVLPNVAGIGPTEFAFLLLFSNYIGSAAASSALILYRTATYFWPFLLSIVVLRFIVRSGDVRSGGL